MIFWGKEGVLKDIERIQAYVEQDKAQVAYAILIDEGGFFRRREAHPGSRWVSWEDGVWALVARAALSQVKR